ncbi:hypothetical protein B2G71_04605 [Novosphingobium sp. PC22D]|uniref:hypothetical protein n=1 Tax=Novosphingobium sp. PC22D TaxID=1962403 RepID=UPI000BF098E1|nr:hypothetical protein [Novosphingobium sp. PC22D]PEQ13614.1 hypothetical protein B2G71_04605 [Novosphingobium sp. PC22D]
MRPLALLKSAAERFSAVWMLLGAALMLASAPAMATAPQAMSRTAPHHAAQADEDCSTRPSRHGPSPLQDTIHCFASCLAAMSGMRPAAPDPAVESPVFGMAPDLAVQKRLTPRPSPVDPPPPRSS